MATTTDGVVVAVDIGVESEAACEGGDLNAKVESPITESVTMIVGVPGASEFEAGRRDREPGEFCTAKLHLPIAESVAKVAGVLCVGLEPEGDCREVKEGDLTAKVESITEALAVTEAEPRCRVVVTVTMAVEESRRGSPRTGHTSVPELPGLTAWDRVSSAGAAGVLSRAASARTVRGLSWP